MLPNQEKRYRRHKRVRSKVFGTAARPRLGVFRSAKHIYASLINDETGRTLLSASDKEVKKAAMAKSAKEIARKARVAVAYEVGKILAERAMNKKIEKAVFDRSGYAYHGIIKALAEGARDGGLKF